MKTIMDVKFQWVLATVVCCLWPVLDLGWCEPSFVGIIPSLTVAAGRDAVLKCLVDDLGSRRVAWIYVEKQTLLTIDTHVITKNTRIGVSHREKRLWFLHIKQVQPEDTGYYMCQINTQPMISQVGHLNVVEPPAFMEDMPFRNVSVMENANVTMACRASGNPPPKIIWTREDGQLFTVGKEEKTMYEGEELHLLGVSRLHMGVYLCKATNGVPPATSRRIHLNVDFPPMIWIPNQAVGSTIGVNVTLECHTEAHPPSVNHWAFSNGEPVPTNLPRYEINEWRNLYKVHMKLKILHLQSSDYGQYKCISRNVLSETAGTVELHRLSMLSSHNTDQPADATVSETSSHRKPGPEKSRELVPIEERETPRFTTGQNTKRQQFGSTRGPKRNNTPDFSPFRSLLWTAVTTSCLYRHRVQAASFFFS